MVNAMNSDNGPRNFPCDLDMFVVDVLRYDIEDVDAILRMLNSTSCVGWRKFWPHDFTRDEVLGALDRLVSRGVAKPLVENPLKNELEEVTHPVDVRNEGGRYSYIIKQSPLNFWNEWNPPVELSD